MQLQNEVRYKDESFYIGNGTFITSNICIPLNAISVIKIVGKKETNLNQGFGMIVAGLLLLAIPMLRIIGTIVLVCGVVVLGCLILGNYLQKNGLVIQVNSGASFLFEHKDIEFIRKIADIIRKGLDDTMQHTTYVDMSNSMINSNFNGNPTFQDFGKHNKFKDTVISGSSGDSENRQKRDVNTYNQESGLSEEEWNRIEKYFHQRAEELGKTNHAYSSCKQMEQYARKKDVEGLSKLMKSVGKTALFSILGKISEFGVKEIIQKIIQMVSK